MANNVIEYKGLDEIVSLMRQFPQKLRQISKVGMEASLLVLWENIPQYPAKPPETKYIRTGTLGRTLGSSEAGGKSGGRPDVFETKSMGAQGYEGRFGTNLNYAPYVIGDSQARQNRHWWKLTDVIPLSEKKIKDIWEGIMQQMVNFLNSRSSGAK